MEIRQHPLLSARSNFNKFQILETSPFQKTKKLSATQKFRTKLRPTPTLPLLIPSRLGRWKISSVQLENGSGATPRSVGGQKNGRGGGDTRRRKGGGGWSSGGRKGEGGFRGLGWVGQTDPDRVNSECTLLRGGLRFAENISPLPPPPWVRHPLPPEVDNAISKYESARGMAKTCVYNAVLRGNVGRKEEEGKSFRGVFSYFILFFFGFSVFLFFFFFSRSRCKFLRLRFLLLLFSLFFFFDR